jgi:hypothetical protein
MFLVELYFLYLYLVGKPVWRKKLGRLNRIWKNDIKINIQRLLSHVSAWLTRFRIIKICWLFWTRWWILSFHEVSEYPCMVKEITALEAYKVFSSWNKHPVCAQLDNLTHGTTTTIAHRPPTFTVHDYNKHFCFTSNS